jgi:hypothetical protein
MTNISTVESIVIEHFTQERRWWEGHAQAGDGTRPVLCIRRLFATFGLLRVVQSVLQRNSSEGSDCGREGRAPSDEERRRRQWWGW